MDYEMAGFRVDVHSDRSRGYGDAGRQKHSSPISVETRVQDHENRIHRVAGKQQNPGYWYIRLDHIPYHHKKAACQAQHSPGRRHFRQPGAEIMPEPRGQECYQHPGKNVLQVRRWWDHKPECEQYNE